MAGSYPDAPSQRMAWDEDGTVAWRTNTAGTSGIWGAMVLSSALEWSLAQRQTINDEVSNASDFTIDVGVGAVYRGFAWIFPEHRDIYGVFHYGWNNEGQAAYSEETSVDSTNGMSGTWVAFPSVLNTTPAHWTGENLYRSNITTFASPVTGVRSIRYILRGAFNLVGGSHWYGLTHIYGTISAGETPDRLLFIDQNTGLEFTEPLDWGDVPRGTTLVHDIKIKNNSATLTANTITLDYEALSGDSDTWHTIKETGGAYGNTLSITSIAAGASYPSGANVITIRLIVADNENLGVQASRLQASTTSWT